MTARNGRVDRPSLAPGERVLLAEPDRDGVPVMATTTAIYVRCPPPTWTRLGWERTLSVRWDSSAGVLSLRGLDEGAPEVRIAPRPRSAIVTLTRERVGATVLASARVAVNGRCRALVSARRRPGSTDVFWVVVIARNHDDGNHDDGTAGHDDATVRDAVSDTIRELRRTAGVPHPT